MKELVCIICPRGCKLKIDDNMHVTGNFCPRGEQYALKEISRPVRTLTTTIRVNNREDTLVSVKTDKPIPKEELITLMRFLKDKSVSAPIDLEDVLFSSPLGLDTNIVSTIIIK